MTSISNLFKNLYFPLRTRILVIILLPVLLYPIIIIYFNKYQDILIRSEFAAIERQGLTLTKALALAENQYGLIQRNQVSSPALQSLIPKVKYGSNIRARLFDMYGNLIADTKASMKYTPFVKVSPLPSVNNNSSFETYLTSFVSLFSNLISRPLDLPLHNEDIKFEINNFPEVVNALKGNNAKVLRKNKSEKLFLSVAIPIKNIRMVRGAVLLSVSGDKIEQELVDLETELFKAFGLILLATLSLAFYFGRSITNPIIKLAIEADKISEDKMLKAFNLTELKSRKDEIGNLAKSFFKMTRELQSRVDHIADFTADVAHELKNPISSMRSASETIGKIKNVKEQKQLIKVIQNDVERVDRLINDISAASRLDAELSRIEMTRINITDLLSTLIEIRSSTINCNINFFKEVDKCYVLGNENRIAQVFDNLIQNAASFSNNNCRIDIRLEKKIKKIIIFLEDNGPGFSEIGMNKVFDRFYTERPKTEKFGNHSGLGLSICKQILEAHGGTIEVFNRFNKKNKCIGASVKTSFNELKL